MSEFQTLQGKLGVADMLIRVEFPDLRCSQARRNFEQSSCFAERESGEGRRGREKFFLLC